MLKLVDKIIRFFKDNKKTLTFIFTIALVGLIAGICFYFFISLEDKNKCIDFINNYINNIKEEKYLLIFIRSFLFNFVLLTIIFICAFSIIGFFTGTLVFFAKNFVIGLYITLISKVTNYYIASTLYFLPSGLIYVFIFSIMILFSLSISTNLVFSLFKGKNICFKNINKKYLYIYLIIAFISLITSLYEGFILPKILLYFL